jgi:hypothetical protein
MLLLTSLLALLISGSEAKCLKLSGKVAQASQNFTVGELVDLAFTLDSFFCKGTVGSVTVKLMEDDVFSDDEILTLTTSASLAKPFQWSVPFDVSAILNAGGEGENGEFFFTLQDNANAGNTGESASFRFSPHGASLSVLGPLSSSYATGTVVEFDVISQKLPSRQITCSLMRPGLLWGSSATAEIVKYTTTAATGAQKKLVQFTLSSAIKSADDYFVQCQTTDAKQPAVTFTAARADYFRINQVTLKASITAPGSAAMPRANTKLRVTWTTDGAGVPAGDKFAVRLFNVVNPAWYHALSPTTALLVRDTEVWSSATAPGVVEPAVTALAFDLPIPVGLGPASFLEGINGQTGKFYVELRLKSNPDYQLRSSQFAILDAVQGCVISKPAANESFVLGADETLRFSCQGYVATENIGRFSLLRADGSGAPSVTPLDNAPRALTSGTVAFKVPATFVQGWVYRVRVSDGEGTPQDSQPFLGRRSGPQCVVADKVARCAGTPALAATLDNAVQVNSITVTWSGPECLSQAGIIKLDTVWQKGSAGAPITTTTNARLVDNQPLVQKLLGSACADCLDIGFSFVEYPTSRKSLSFDIKLILPLRNAAELPLGTVKFVDAVGAQQTASEAGACVGNTAAPPKTPVPPIIEITDPPGVSMTLRVVGATIQDNMVSASDASTTTAALSALVAGVAAAAAASAVLM